MRKAIPDIPLEFSKRLNKIVEVNKIRIDKWSNNKYNDKNYKNLSL